MNLRIQIDHPLDRFPLRLDLHLQADTVGIMGPSGAGKTTTLQILAGLTRPLHGHITFDGTPWLAPHRRPLPPEARDIGYVPQEGLLFPHLSVRDNILAGAARARRQGRRPLTLLREAAALLELEPLLHRRTRDLSGGERQRVALARALCSGPRLLLLDEPLSGLDLPLRRRILPLLARARQHFHLPMILVSHDPIEIQALCAEALLLSQGTIRAHGAPADLFADPDLPHIAHGEDLGAVFSATAAPDATVTLAPGISLNLPLDLPPDTPVLLGLSARDIHLGVGPLQGRIRRLFPRHVSLDLLTDSATPLPPLVAERPPRRPLAEGEILPLSLGPDPTRWRLLGR